MRSNFFVVVLAFAISISAFAAGPAPALTTKNCAAELVKAGAVGLPKSAANTFCSGYDLVALNKALYLFKNEYALPYGNSLRLATNYAPQILSCSERLFDISTGRSNELPSNAQEADLIQKQKNNRNFDVYLGYCLLNAHFE